MLAPGIHDTNKVSQESNISIETRGAEHGEGKTIWERNGWKEGKEEEEEEEGKEAREGEGDEAMSSL